jgi:hypothetical protein
MGGACLRVRQRVVEFLAALQLPFGFTGGFLAADYADGADVTIVVFNPRHPRNPRPKSLRCLHHSFTWNPDPITRSCVLGITAAVQLQNSPDDISPMTTFRTRVGLTFVVDL